MPNLSVISTRFSRCAKLFIISARPNTPIATTAKSMPSCSSGILKSKRATPEFTSVPTIPINRPRIIIQIAFANDPEASTTAPIKPKHISEKYSAGPNLKATSVNGGAKAANRTVATQPAKNEPKAAMDRAAPARPFLAIW